MQKTEENMTDRDIIIMCGGERRLPDEETFLLSSSEATLKKQNSMKTAGSVACRPGEISNLLVQ